MAWCSVKAQDNFTFLIANSQCNWIDVKLINRSNPSVLRFMKIKQAQICRVYLIASLEKNNWSKKQSLPGRRRLPTEHCEAPGDPGSPDPGVTVWGHQDALHLHILCPCSTRTERRHACSSETSHKGTVLFNVTVSTTKSSWMGFKGAHTWWETRD